MHEKYPFQGMFCKLKLAEIHFLQKFSYEYTFCNFWQTSVTFFAVYSYVKENSMVLTLGHNGDHNMTKGTNATLAFSFYYNFMNNFSVMMRPMTLPKYTPKKRLNKHTLTHNKRGWGMDCRLILQLRPNIYIGYNFKNEWCSLLLYFIKDKICTSYGLKCLVIQIFYPLGLLHQATVVTLFYNYFISQLQ